MGTIKDLKKGYKPKIEDVEKLKKFLKKVTKNNNGYTYKN